MLAGVAAVAVAGGGVYWQQTGGFTGEDAAPAQSVAPVAEPKVVPAPIAKQPVTELKPIRLKYEPEMVSIPAGTFTMGCVESRDVVDGMEDKCYDYEKPAHEVTLNAFQVGKYEVTFDQWDACEQAKVCPHAEDKGWGRGNRPVINVSWDDITQKYIPWLNKETGKTYRLPTEAEWEYAARGGADTAYPWGNAIGKGNVNCDNVSCGDKFEYTAPVGSFAANGYGLSDMHGNVLEWCQDWYGDYSSSSVSNPKGVASGPLRVLRGGSWNYDAQGVRSASRGGSTPDIRLSHYGFRLVLP